MVLQRRTEIADVIDRILDKGIVVDHEARISMLGVDLGTAIESRVVMSSIDTFIRYVPSLTKPGRLLDRMAEAEKERDD